MFTWRFVFSIMVFLGVSVFIFISLSNMFPFNNDKGQSLETRIELLSSSLQDASRTISDIEKEVEARQALLKQLED